MALSVKFDLTLALQDFTAGNISSSTITLDTEKCNALDNIDMFIGIKLRDLMTLLVQKEQLDIIRTTPTICVPGVARITIHNFDFDNTDNDHDEQVDQPRRNPEINDEKKIDIDSFISELREAFITAIRTRPDFAWPSSRGRI